MTRVIIIDDDKEAADTLNEYLEISKIEGLACGYNGKDAVELYKKHQPDVVLLDLVMPEFDGYYAIENIRKINPDAKIIVLTGSVQEYYGKKLVELKPYTIFIKPFMIKELVTMIEKDSNKLEQITV